MINASTFNKWNSRRCSLGLSRGKALVYIRVLARAIFVLKLQPSPVTLPQSTKKGYDCFNLFEI